MEKFYRALEERFRGNKKEIKRKLSIYLELLKEKEKKVLDLGCGRGEFLELLKENGFNNLYGVDINREMTQEIKDITIFNEDALSFLKKQKDKSFSIIASFHLIEHLDFQIVFELIKECYRVLDEDGILILETPNPENIKVACESFYIDPTHKNPIPSDLLKFVVEYFGFSAKILRVNEPNNIQNSIKDVIEHVSPDYAVIGFKNPKMINEEFFNRGVSLDLIEYNFEERMKNIEERIKNLEIEKLITENYHLKEINKNLNYENQQLKKHIDFIENENQNLKSKIEHLVNENQNLKSNLKSIENENYNLKSQIENLNNENQNLKSQLSFIQSLYNDVINSKSWKITKPLRELTNFIRKKKRKTILKITTNDTNYDELSPRAKEIYEKLKKEIKANNDFN